MDFWRNKKVLILGHTGFKGSWLCQWLLSAGADLCGYSLAPDTTPALFDDLELADKIDHHIGDICDVENLNKVFQDFKPEIVFHMASQPIVSVGFSDPVGTYMTNTMGTVNVLQAIRHCDSTRAVVVVTSDKCYENIGENAAFTEDDRLGGFDPYSNSKACQELIVQSYRASFFTPDQSVRIATARAGNVIGGGDWALNRLVPDLARAFLAGESAIIRNPAYTRPWQHVLDPLNGYIMLAEKLYGENGFDYAQGWNFGPEESHCIPVSEVVETSIQIWGDDAAWHHESIDFGKECTLLRLSSTKAKDKLGWSPSFDVYKAIEMSMLWYKMSGNTAEIKRLTDTQISQIEKITTPALKIEAA